MIKNIIIDLKYRFRLTADYRYVPTIERYHDGWGFFWLNWFYVLKLPANEKIRPSIDFKVNLKIIREKWYCFQTIKGYDYSFSSHDKLGALKQMKEQIIKLYSSTGRLDVNLLITQK